MADKSDGIRCRRNKISILLRGAAAALLLAMTAILPISEARADTPVQLVPAKIQFDYGLFNDAVRMVDELLGQKLLTTEEELTEAWRIRGLACLYQGRQDDARDSFLQLLMLSPDYELDSMTVSPDAIQIFDQIKRENAELLEPIRAKIQAIALQKLQEQKSKEDTTCRNKTILVRRVETMPFLTVFLPFGAPQFSRGRTDIGTVFAISQSIAVTGSVFTWAKFRSKRGSDGRVGKNQLDSARKWRIANWSFVGLAAALYVGGLADAIVHHKSETVTDVELLVPNTQDTEGFTPASAAEGISASFYISPIEGGGTVGVSGHF